MPGAIAPYTQPTFTNVKKFGAVGDSNGSTGTDDTAAIQAAIDSLPARGGTIFFPSGWYLVTGTLDLGTGRGIRLVGEGGMSSGSGPASAIICTAALSQTCTIHASTGVITSTAHGYSVGDFVTITTDGTLPTGLSPDRSYYVKTVPTADTMTVAATSGGTAITTSSAGSGTHRLAKPLIDARYHEGFELRDIFVQVTSASFTGHIIDASGPTAATAHNTLSIEGCWIGGTNATAYNAASCLFLDNTHIGTYRNCFFGPAKCHVYANCRSDTQSNVHSFVGCTFANHSVMSVQNPRDAWAFTGCAWEPGLSSVLRYIDYTTASAYGSGISLDGCYSEGVASGSNYAFRFTGYAVGIKGCFLGGGVHTIELGYPSGTNSMLGLCITGTRFVGGSNTTSTHAVYSNIIGSGLADSWFIAGNSRDGVTSTSVFVGFTGGAEPPLRSVVMQANGSTFYQPSAPIQTKYGTPSDSDYAVTPPVGTKVLDTLNRREYTRTDTATWQYVTLT